MKTKAEAKFPGQLARLDLPEDFEADRRIHERANMDRDVRVNILLVDDQPSRLMSYEAILSELGQNLVCVRSGTEALECLMKDDYAVVLLDVNMPGMDGFETASLIHQHPRFEKTPIIFVTGVHVTEIDRLKGYQLGAVDYVSVPVVPEILRSKVAVLVELHCKRRELQNLNRRLEQANAQLAEANATLQAERAQELERLNRTLRQANEALKEADRRKDEFLATLAHELRNPLAPIRNAVQILKAPSVSESQRRWSRDVIDRQVQHMARLLEDLLDVSRITRGKIELRKERVAIRSAVETAIETARPLVNGKKHTLRLQLPAEPIWIEADPARMTQILGNLLTNAAKYTPAGGRIRIAASKEGAEVVIRIQDDGIGITEEHRSRLFRMFAQAREALASSEGGLGVGLAITKGLVELHGGRIEARSEGPGKGSEFIVRLPLA